MSKQSDGKKNNGDSVKNGEQKSAGKTNADEVLEPSKKQPPESPSKVPPDKPAVKEESTDHQSHAKKSVSKDKSAEVKNKGESEKKTAPDAVAKASPKQHGEGKAAVSEKNETKEKESVPAAVSKSQSGKSEVKEAGTSKTKNSADLVETASSEEEKNAATKDAARAGAEKQQVAKKAPSPATAEGDVTKPVKSPAAERQKSVPDKTQEEVSDRRTEANNVPDAKPELEPEPRYVDETRTDVIITSVQEMLKPKATFLTRAELISASRELKRVTPYNYEAWRLHADVLLDALKQLVTRQIQPDDQLKILAIPLRENDIRDAAEAALRQCAHYAPTVERRIALIDEANSVRRANLVLGEDSKIEYRSKSST